MASFDERQIIEPFNFDNDYIIRFASGSSFFEVNIIDHFEGNNNEIPQEGVWQNLKETEYELLGKKLFIIDSARKNPSALSGTPPILHIELAFTDMRKFNQKNFIVLILDDNGNLLVDWAVANHVQDVSSFFDPTQNVASIYFDIPLVPSTEQLFETEQPIITPEDISSFQNKIGQWESGKNKLTFGIFCFEDDEINSEFDKHYYAYGLPSYANNTFVRARISTITRVIARKADRFLKHNTGGDEQLQIIDEHEGIRVANEQDLLQMRGKTFLFCHGILSSTEGAFSTHNKLLKPSVLNDKKFMTCLRNYYGKNILAWDHYTLSKTTADNATDLLKKLKKLSDVDLDIVCHSRGAGVIRNLVENKANQQQLINQNVRINEIIFVAGACLGSQLADSYNTNRLFRSLNMIYWFFGGAPVGFISGILTVLKLLATVAQKMPGIESMNPRGKEIATLNLNTNTSAQRYNYIRANYYSNKLPAKLLQEFLWNTIVFGGANDLVVPYDGAGVSNNYLNSFLRKNDAKSFGTTTQSQAVVMHTNFFTQPDTKWVLSELLNLNCII